MHRTNLLKMSGYLVYLALLGSLLSIAPEINIIPLSVFVACFITGFFLDQRQDNSPVISPLILFFILMAGILVSLAGIDYENLFSRVVGILLIIISAKLISPKKSRDLLQIYLLNFFLMTSSAITRLDLEFGLLILGETYIFLLGLVLIYGSGEQEEMLLSHIRKLAGWSAVITLSLIPATVIIFLIIPRPTMTMFAWGGGSVTGSGFSDTVSPGSVEQIKLDNSPVLRIRWIKGERPKHPMWRGLVYDRYNQGSWERTHEEDVSIPTINEKSGEYEVLSEPTGTKYLFSIGVPYHVRGRLLRPLTKPGFTVETRRDTNRRIIYKVTSYLIEDLPRDIDPDLYLDIPNEIQSKIQAIARDLIQDTDYDTSINIRDFLVNNLNYDLSPGTPSGDPVLYFLNESKKGHCEYFASTMALMLRSIGIPARIVGGYLGGDWNELGQYYLVRQKDAHTWVETWIPDKGWVVFDPTPPAPSIPEQGYMDRIMHLIDFLRLKWYYWVIDYNVNKQMDLAHLTRDFFRSIKGTDSRTEIMKSLPESKTLIYFVAGIAMLILIVMSCKYIKNRPRGWAEKFVLLMKKSGYERASGQTIMELASSISNKTPVFKEKAIIFSKEYYRLEYGQQGSNDELKRLFTEITYL